MAEDNKVHGINVDENDSWPGKVVGTNYLYRKNDNGELILNDRDTVEMCGLSCKDAASHKVP